MRAALNFVKAAVALTVALAILALLLLIALAFLVLVILAQVTCPFMQCDAPNSDIWAFTGYFGMFGVPTILLLLMMMISYRRAR